MNGSNDLSGSTRLPVTELLTAKDAKEEREGRGGTASNDAALTSRVRLGAWSFLILAALIDTIAGRHAMNPDGISYLDMGDAMMRGEGQIVTGVKNKIRTSVASVTPASMLAKQHRKSAQPGTAGKRK